MIKSKYFNTGKVVCTAGVNNVMTQNEQFAKDVTNALVRFCNKDWGDLCDDNKQMNEEALAYPDDLYLLAAYHTCAGKIYIITNRISEQAGDNATTIMFPSER